MIFPCYRFVEQLVAHTYHRFGPFEKLIKSMSRIFVAMLRLSEAIIISENGTVLINQSNALTGRISLNLYYIN